LEVDLQLPWASYTPTRPSSLGGLFAWQQRLADTLTQGVVAVAGQWLAVRLDLDQALAAAIALQRALYGRAPQNIQKNLTLPTSFSLPNKKSKLLIYAM